MDFRMSRDTCICEMPTRVAICVWVMPSKKRRWRIRRSRWIQAAHGRSQVRAVARPVSYAFSSAPRQSSSSRDSSSSASPAGEDGHRIVGPVRSPAPRPLPPRSRQQAWANSAMVGERLQLHGELLDDPVQSDVQVLKGPRHLDRPALVAEVALDLAHDGRGGVGGELDAPPRSKRSMALISPMRADLDQILHRLPARGEAPGQAPDQRQIAGDELFAGGQVLSSCTRTSSSLSGRSLRVAHRKPWCRGRR